MAKQSFESKSAQDKVFWLNNFSVKLAKYAAKKLRCRKVAQFSCGDREIVLPINNLLKNYNNKSLLKEQQFINLTNYFKNL